MKVLHLTLKKKWFDLIEKGVKKEEYREMKPYWTKRLFNDLGNRFESKEYDCIRFRNGYSKDAPTMDVEFKGVRRDLGIKQWGAIPGEVYYVISLGKILNIANKPKRSEVNNT